MGHRCVAEKDVLKVRQAPQCLRVVVPGSQGQPDPWDSVCLGAIPGHWQLQVKSHLWHQAPCLGDSSSPGEGKPGAQVSQQQLRGIPRETRARQSLCPWQLWSGRNPPTFTVLGSRIPLIPLLATGPCSGGQLFYTQQDSALTSFKSLLH